MAQYSYISSQIVQPNQPWLFNNVQSCGCPKGYLYHTDGTGIVVVKGTINNPNTVYARYTVRYNGNIAVAENGTVGPIASVVTLNGEPLLNTKAIVTPSAVSVFNHISGETEILIPRGCCFNLAVENIPDGTDLIPIEVINANLDVRRIG